MLTISVRAAKSSTLQSRACYIRATKPIASSLQTRGAAKRLFAKFEKPDLTDAPDAVSKWKDMFAIRPKERKVKVRPEKNINLSMPLFQKYDNEHISVMLQDIYFLK
jgi:hypothetical protein